MITPQHSFGYSASACSQICRSSSVVTIIGGLAIQRRGAAGQRRDDCDLVALLQRGAETAEPVDRLAVHVDGDVLMDLTRFVAHQSLEAAVRALQLVQQRADGGRAHVDPVAIRGRAPERRRNIHGRHLSRLWAPTWPPDPQLLGAPRRSRGAPRYTARHGLLPIFEALGSPRRAGRSSILRQAPD